MQLQPLPSQPNTHAKKKNLTVTKKWNKDRGSFFRVADSILECPTLTPYLYMKPLNLKTIQ